jgi:hypothetical protein
MLCHAPVPLDARHADSLNIVIPAKAGIHFAARQEPMDSRLRGNDELENLSVTHVCKAQ